MTAATIAGHSNKSEYSKKNGYRKSSKTPWGNPIVYFFSLVLVAICITPVLYIIFGGFRTNSQITNHPSGMPNPWVPDNYKTVFESDIFWTELKNSTIVGIATMVGVVVLSIMVSFVIARYKFRYAPLMYALFSAGLMFPMTVGITEHEQRQHVGIPASHEGKDSSGGHARHGQRNDHAPEEAKAGASIEKTGLLKLIRNRL